MSNPAPLNQDTPTVKPMSAWSKVTQPALTHRLSWSLIVGGGVGIVWAMMSWVTQPSTVKPSTPITQSTRHYQASLAANLARLQALAHQPPKPAPDAHTLLTGRAKVRSHAELARQNAPTTAYSSPIDATTHCQGDTPRSPHTGDTQGLSQTLTPLQVQSLLHPAMTLAAGEFLQAVLETAIDSDVPGPVRAVVSTPAYAYTGERVLIPAGSRLLGHYVATPSQGQQRVIIRWDQVFLPQGVSLTLNSPSTDDLGRNGQAADGINTHFWARWGQASLFSLIGAGVSAYNSPTAEARYPQAIAQSFQQSAQQSLQGTVSLKPTLYIHQGARLVVFVSRNLDFYPLFKAGNTTRRAGISGIGEGL